MFDLFRSRDKVVRVFLGAILVIVALSMVTYLIPGGYGSGSAQDNVVAEIGKDQITARQALAAVQSALRGRQVPPDMIPLYVPQLIDQMITERSLAYEARRLGLQVTDEQTSEAIRTAIPQLFQDGKFVGANVYANFLAQQNISIPEFEREIRQQVLVNRLRVIVAEGIVVTPSEVEQEFRKRNEKVKIEYVNITPDKLRAEVHVSPEEVRAYYEKSKLSFTTPEKRSLAVLVIDQNKVEQSINPTEAEVRRAYETDKERFRTPERVKVRHILLKTTGKAPAEEAKIKAKAEDLLKQLKGGADFAKLAKENSEDTGSAVKGGDLDWIVRGQTVKPFEEAAFSLKPNDISDPIKTEYGYHIIQVLDKQQAKLKSFEEARPDLLSDYKRQRAGQMLQDLSDKAYAGLRKNPLHPEQVASDLKLAPPFKVENISMGDPLPEIGVNKDFEQSLAGLKTGEVSQPVQIAPNKLAMAVLTKSVPVHPASFEEAQTQARQQLEKEKLAQLVNQRTAQLLEKSRALNGDLRKAVESMGLEVKTSGDFDRNGAIEGLGSAGMLPAAFTTAPGAIFGPVSIGESRVFGKVISKTPPNPAELSAQSVGIRDELKSRKARERNMLFEDGIRKRLIKEGKVKIHRDVFNRVVASYRA